MSLRKLPFNLTVRYRSTGKLIGRLDLPDLLLNEEHPLIENGPRALPVARDGPLLAVTDGWYYIMRGRGADEGGVEAADRRERPDARCRRCASR